MNLMIEKKSAIFDSVDWRETTGARLYRRAKERIPGGVQLLSKQPERYLPELWPSYYSRARGCEVWDLDGRRSSICATAESARVCSDLPTRT